jgi:glycosyltransferase involved in cell wall biosynthesis
MSMRKKILVMISYYLPGYKAGGPIQSIKNLSDWLGEELSFQILTSNHDFQEKVPYPGIKTGVWKNVGSAKVMYLSPKQMSFVALRNQLQRLEYDFIYLNSYLDLQTRRILMLRRMGMIPGKPVVLAPRGQFSTGALGLKRLKKQMYIPVAMRLGLYDNIIWQATNENEKQNILFTLGRFVPDLAQRIRIAPNLGSRVKKRDSENFIRHKNPHCVRVVFLSRISRMKNIDYGLRLLSCISGDVVFDIYGPIEDGRYWEECKAIISKLPSNIHVSYRGEIHPDQVHDTLSQYHLFLFPTLGENFGHVVLEAMTAGCIILISDKTQWRGLAEKKVGWDIALSEQDRFKIAFNMCTAMSDDEFSIWSNSATAYARSFILWQSSTVLQSYRDLFS